MFKKEFQKAFIKKYETHDYFLTKQEVENLVNGFWNIWSHLHGCSFINAFNIEFGLKSGIAFDCYGSTIYFLTGKSCESYFKFELSFVGFGSDRCYDISELDFQTNSISWTYNGTKKTIKCSGEEIELVKEYILGYKKMEKEINEIEAQKKKNDELTRVSNLKKAKIEYLHLLDKDGDGKVDLVEGDSFYKILNQNQKIIIDFDKEYIQKFIRVSSYLKTKRNNIEKIFEYVRESTSENSLNEFVMLLRNQIHTYELQVFHSINMLTALIEGDLFTFYEIYELFDQLGVLNSNWENEVAKKLIDIGDKIHSLMYAIHDMENNIVTSIEKLSYVNQESFSKLTKSVEKQLFQINSNINFNNLLTGIQAYQLYKINKNTKRIN